jgi:D-cysteine desulfhydrase
VTFALFELSALAEARVPRIPLGRFPTAVESLDRVARALGAGAGAAWVKRDDISSSSYGGNKVRTLELLFGQARARGHAHVVSTGAFGSNHALATAIHGPQVGFRPHALLFPQPISGAAFSNLSALARTGATLHSLPHWSALPFGAVWLRASERFSAEPGRKPYLMVPGGATPLGALGYVSAALELGRQVLARELPAPRRVIVAVGSTCTSAGLLLGFALAAHVRAGFEPSTIPRLTSVRVSPWPVTSRLRILRLATRTSRLLHELSAGSLPIFDARALGAHFEVETGFLGPGYGKPSSSGDEAEEIWRELGLPALDGTYSAKAAARVVFGLRAREAGPVLFWSTKSSTPLPEQDALPWSSVLGPSAIPARIRAWLAQAERALSVPGA